MPLYKCNVLFQRNCTTRGGTMLIYLANMSISCCDQGPSVRLCRVWMSWRSWSRRQRSYLVCDPRDTSLEMRDVCVRPAECPSSVPMQRKSMSVVLFHHLRKQCTVNLLPRRKSNTFGALPTSPSITINVNSLFISLLSYNGGNVKSICSRRNTGAAPGLRNLPFHLLLFVSFCESM